MQMLYNSDNFIVVQFDIAPEGADAAADGGSAAPTIGRGGFEIVDKAARKEIYIEGLLAESFKAGVQQIVDHNPSPEAFEEFIGRYTALAQQPLVAH
ncbi:MAG: DUF3567 domain-containing protein [Proteobacteria bacterium]|nr:DUF3567 domain-containing protein [Pseudomonadota bacterium]